MRIPRTPLVVGLIVTGCGMSQEEHRAKLQQALAEQKATCDAEMKKMQAAHQEAIEAKTSEIEGRDSLIAGLESEIETLGGNLQEVRSSLGEELAARAAELAAARQELEASQAEILTLQRLREKAEREKAQFEALTRRFKKMIDAGKLEVVRRDGRMMLKLPDDILFPSGQKRLKKGGREALGEVAQVLKEAAADRDFLVAGHTDDVPVGPRSRFRSNWELSTARATEVVNLLIDEGVPPESLAAAGYGEYDPIADNDTPEGRERNRRLEIIILPKLEDLDV
jgi:chemotaxis protein MotB